MSKAILNQAVRLSGKDGNGSNVAPNGHVVVPWSNQLKYFFPSVIAPYYPSSLQIAGTTSNYGDPNLVNQLTAAEIDATLGFFAAVSKIAGLTFSSASSSVEADISIAGLSLANGGVYAFSESIGSSSINVDTQASLADPKIAGDVWLFNSIRRLLPLLAILPT